MKTPALFILISLFGIAAQAGDFVSLPIAVFCKVKVDGEPAHLITSRFFRAKLEKGGNGLADRQGEKVRGEYIQPAMNAACASAYGSGSSFIDAAKSACSTGCYKVNGQLGAKLSAEQQTTLRAVCESGCDIGEAALHAWAYGVAAGIESVK